MRTTRLFIGALFVAVVALAGTVGSASAAHVTPSTGSGNPSCAGGIKIEPVVSGTYGPITIVVSGSSFSFTTTDFLVTSVIVKGGPGYNLYSYGLPGVESDSGLTAPVRSGTRTYGLSHLCFFGDDKKDPDPK